MRVKYGGLAGSLVSLSLRKLAVNPTSHKQVCKGLGWSWLRVHAPLGDDKRGREGGREAVPYESDLVSA